MTAMTLLFSLLMLFLAPWPQQNERRNAGGRSGNDELTLDGARPIMDNARVTVWDFTWTRGVPEAMERTTSNAIWVSIAPVTDRPFTGRRARCGRRRRLQAPRRDRSSSS